MKFTDDNQNIDKTVVKFHDDYSLYITLINKTT